MWLELCLLAFWAAVLLGLYWYLEYVPWCRAQKRAEQHLRETIEDMFGGPVTGTPIDPFVTVAFYTSTAGYDVWQHTTLLLEATKYLRPYAQPGALYRWVQPPGFYKAKVDGLQHLCLRFVIDVQPPPTRIVT